MVNYISWTCDGQYIVSGSNDRVIKIWTKEMKLVRVKLIFFLLQNNLKGNW